MYPNIILAESNTLLTYTIRRSQSAQMLFPDDGAPLELFGLSTGA